MAYFGFLLVLQIPVWIILLFWSFVNQVFLYDWGWKYHELWFEFGDLIVQGIGINIILSLLVWVNSLDE